MLQVTTSVINTFHEFRKREIAKYSPADSLQNAILLIKR